MYSKEELKNLKLEFGKASPLFVRCNPICGGVRKFGHYMIRR